MIVSAQLGTGQNAHAGLWWTFFKSFAAEETRFFRWLSRKFGKFLIIFILKIDVNLKIFSFDKLATKSD